MKREREWRGRDSQIHCDYICYAFVRRSKYQMKMGAGMDVNMAELV